jgi:peptidoglycan/LPS O-acetylase OafA/YrhL
MFGSYRTFLAVLVIANHIGGISEIGRYAVYGFFVLSGYLMTYITSKKIWLFFIWTGQIFCK